MKGTQGVGELGQNLSLGPQTNHQRIDKTITHSGASSVRQFSAGLGVVEVAIAILIALRPWSPKTSTVGSALAVVMFLTTLSFLFSTPGWEPSLGGFPALSALPGQFLLKDVVLLGAAIWSLGESLTSVSMRAAE